MGTVPANGSRGENPEQPPVDLLGAYECGPHFSRRVEAGFTAGQVSSDGGALLLRGVEGKIKLLGRLSGCFRDARNPELVADPIQAADHREQKTGSTGLHFTRSDFSTAEIPPRCPDPGRHDAFTRTYCRRNLSPTLKPVLYPSLMSFPL
jgi:hypothetical protein